VTAPPQVDAETPALSPKRSRPVVVVAHPDLCTLCEVCLDACVRGAITLTGAPEVDARLCTGCGACEDACPNDVFALAEV
jgi:ferredoxin